MLRSGEELEYEIEMQPLQTLVPVHKYDQLPSYFIYAGEAWDLFGIEGGGECTRGGAALVPVHKYDQLPNYFIYAGERACALLGMGWGWWWGWGWIT